MVCDDKDHIEATNFDLTTEIKEAADKIGKLRNEYLLKN